MAMEFIDGELVFFSEVEEEETGMQLTLGEKANILGGFWIRYKNDKDFSLFIEHNDIGLPISYYFSEGLVNTPTEIGEEYIHETFSMFINALQITNEELFSIKDNLSIDGIMKLVSARPSSPQSISKESKQQEEKKPDHNIGVENKEVNLVVDETMENLEDFPEG